MWFVLSPQGRLHRDGRCRATGYRFALTDDMELLGFLYLPFTGLCLNCFPARSGPRD